ncbi:MAG: NAD-binding protein, partial [bacterium]
MKAVIAGCGAVGRNLAEMLVREGNNVTVIDTDRGKLDSVEEYLDVAAVEGQCTDLKALRSAGVHGCDIFVAATDDDEANIVAAVAAKRLGAGKCAARCRNQIYSSTLDGKGYSDLIDIDLVVNPENLTALEIVKLIKTPGSLVIENMAKGKVHLREIVVGRQSKAIGKTLKSLSLGQIGL